MAKYEIKRYRGARVFVVDVDNSRGFSVICGERIEGQTFFDGDLEWKLVSSNALEEA